jgi:hypothetical protein
MVDREHPHRPAAQLVHLRAPVDAGDAALGAGQQLGGEVAEGADHAWLDQLHLPVQVGLAGVDLALLGVAVARRPALEHVGDEDVGALQADLAQQLVQQLARPADEGQPLEILLLTGGLAYEHQVGVRVAGAEHHPGAAQVQRAACAGRGLPV